MNLLFFDIECACVYKNTAKICAFGYVLCDEKFNIIEKKDILINPKGKFHLTDGRGEHGLVLPYEYSQFKNYPCFPQVYPQIRELLQDRGNLVFGHATLNDVKYLDLETLRFKLQPFDFSFSDSQLMYMTSIGDFTRQFGLEYITKDLNVEFTPHRAADDAYATMMVVKALCAKHGCDVVALSKLLGIKCGKVKNHKVLKPDSENFCKFRAESEIAKKQRGIRRNKFYIAVNRRHKIKNDKLGGKTFNFSRGLEDKTDVSIPLVEKIYSFGGKYTKKLAQCNIYVCEEDDISLRTKAAKQTDGIKIIDLVQLEELLND